MYGNSRYDVIWFVNNWYNLIWSPSWLIAAAVLAIVASISLASFNTLPPKAFWVTIAMSLTSVVTLVSVYAVVYRTNVAMWYRKVTTFEQLIRDQQYEDARRFLSLEGFDYNRKKSVMQKVYIRK